MRAVAMRLRVPRRTERMVPVLDRYRDDLMRHTRVIDHGERSAIRVRAVPVASIVYVPIRPVPVHVIVDDLRNVVHPCLWNEDDLRFGLKDNRRRSRNSYANMDVNV